VAGKLWHLSVTRGRDNWGGRGVQRRHDIEEKKTIKRRNSSRRNRGKRKKDTSTVARSVH